MTNEELRLKIRNVLRGHLFPGDDELVHLSDGHDGSIHVVVVSSQFDGRRMKDKHDLIWSVLTQYLEPDEWGQVTLSIGVSPEELKAM